MFIIVPSKNQWLSMPVTSVGYLLEKEGIYKGIVFKIKIIISFLFSFF